MYVSRASYAARKNDQKSEEKRNKTRAPAKQRQTWMGLEERDIWGRALDRRVAYRQHGQKEIGVSRYQSKTRLACPLPVSARRVNALARDE